MITEDYVSFETAKLLKEKGFNEGCRARYGTAGSFSYEKYEIETSGCEMYNAILAPTLQMVIKWLREVHKIDISISPCREDSDHFYEFYLYKNGTEIFTKTNWLYSKYEEACETAIKYCLENLI